MAERRRYIRFEVPLKVEVTIEGIVDSIQKGATKNFSREGLSLVLHEFHLSTGAQVDLRIYVPKRRKPVSAKGEVVWVQSTHNQWELGVKIRHIIFNYTFFILNTIITVLAEPNLFTSNREELGLQTPVFQYIQCFSKDILSCLLPWTPTYTYYSRVFHQNIPRLKFNKFF